jgi:fructan beta-fructosidase
MIQFWKILCGMVILLLSATASTGQKGTATHDSMHRPQIHFSPARHWANDPNGMVYNDGIYHLFYQHHPNSSVWGPMHWGHATSEDLIHWTHQPIALYPDSLGTIFSGSAVVDKQNTSGFGKNGKVPLVAIFTHHNHKTEKTSADFQNQSLAYSLDNGKTWTKYAGNPVLKNPGIVDFRDPKVMWHEQTKKWIMTLATKDCITFYSSPDLKQWKKESEFGRNAGAHGGVWECPDLFPLDDHGKTVWVLIVSLNPGGPNGGSATQYFLGDFDGHTFHPYSTETKWMDYGPDDYAGITWSNTGNRKIFLGWMTNWSYANQVPTETWRNAMTLPRELKLVHAGNEMHVASMPVAELSVLQHNVADLKNTAAKGQPVSVEFPCQLNFALEQAGDFSIVLSNTLGEELIIGYEKAKNQFYIDRSKSGKIDFQKDFAAKHVAPRIGNDKQMSLTLVVDLSSVELFADNGLTTMTSVFFPNEPFNQLKAVSKENGGINKMQLVKLKSIWKP